MRGFRGYRRPEHVSEAALTSFLDRSGLSSDNANLYVMWTGGNYRRRLGSARSSALFTLDVKNKPVRLADWITLSARCRASEADPQFGYDPATVRSGLFLHQGAKPCVYLALERKADGSFVAAKNVPVPDGSLGFVSLNRGDVVIAADDGRDAIAEVELNRSETSLVESQETKALPAPETTANKRARGRRR
jgi:hypothetical protein